MKNLELRIPPLIQLVLVALAMWLLAAAFPAARAPIPFAAGLSIIVVAAGFLVALLGVLEFRRVNTTVDPRFPDKSSHLVASGIYRFSRNPMYLGFLLALLGWAFWLRNYLPFLLLPVFVLYMNRFQIQPEEKFLRQTFGDEFDAYATRVRRWL